LELFCYLCLEGIYQFCSSRNKNGELPTEKLVHVAKTHGCTFTLEVLESVLDVMDTLHELSELSGKKVIHFIFYRFFIYCIIFSYIDIADPYRVFWTSRKAQREHAGEMLPLQV
jgi:hypothetical protein